jgi:hypothetical protein
VENGGPCPIFDPIVNAGIQYQVRNSTSQPITSLQVFTTENNGADANKYCSGCTSWWHSWHNDNLISLKSGSILKPGSTLPEYGWTAWFDNTSNSNGTRWFIKYCTAQGKCSSTVSYNNDGKYLDTSNLCDYSQNDVENNKYRPTILDIRDGYAAVIPPTQDRACTIKMQ